MLNQLRKGAGTWVAKIFIGLLVLSFAVWGIADIFSGYGTRMLAKVGEIEVSPLEYERSMQRQIRRISQQVGRQITSEQARAFGLDRQVLNSLITNAAVTSHAQQLGLGISDASIRDEIFKSPTFQGSDGKFSRIQFDEVLRNNNLNETGYIIEQRVGAVRDQLILSLSSDLYVPKSMTKNLNRYNNDSRTLEYFILPKTAIDKIADPDAKTQQAFLDSNIRTFTAPEYRKIGVLTLSSAIVQESIKITKEDVAADYEARLDQFSIPGQRHIRRMSFIDREKAKEARQELTAGADFLEVAKKYGFKTEGMDLGFIDKTSLVDPRVAGEAFTLKKGDISQVIESTLSNIILQVVDIKPGKIQKKLVDVEAEIRTYLISERAADKIGSLHDTIEDERAAGKSLADIAKQLDLTYTLVEAVDLVGLDSKGHKVTSVSLDPRLLKLIFESDIGVENEPIEATGGVVNWPEVLGVTPARLKKLDEVKDQLVKLWKERQRETKLSKIASDTLAALRKGEKLQTFAKKYKAKMLKSTPFRRAQEHDDIPTATVNQAFVLPLNGVGMNSIPDGKGRVIFRVVGKGVAKEPSSEADKKLATNISHTLQNDVVAQYVADLRKTYGVTVNQKVLQRLNGSIQ
jgi:peptidyl-prolyl cis-trans isomerase D